MSRGWALHTSSFGPRHPPSVGFLTALLTTVSAAALAQSVPVPPLPEPRQAPAPGFDEEEETPPRRRTPRTETEARAPAATDYGRTPGRDEPEPPLRPLSERSRAPGEALAELLQDTRGTIELSELLDEVLADVAATLERFPTRRVSPTAVRQVVVGSNVQSSFGAVLRNRVTAMLQRGTGWKVVRCLACEATRSRVVGDQLVVTRGLTSQAALRKTGLDLGVRTFLDIRFGFDPDRAILELDFQLFRAEDGEVLWAETYRADETTPMLMRASDAAQTREARLEDLNALLEGRPLFGYAATAGVMLMPYNDPIDGDIFGATAGFRLFERFGTDRRVIFGLDVMGFVNFETLSGALVSAAGWWVPLEPDLVNPELRVGGKAGAFIAGTEGNTTVFQLGAELLLRYRFGIYAYATYVLEAAYPGPNNNDQGMLGGLGTSVGLSFNW